MIMEKYNYREAIANNIQEWMLMNGIIPHAVNQGWDKDQLAEWLYNELWDHDCITGNGPYCFAPEEKCQEYVCTNLDLYFEAASEFDDFPNSGTPWIHRNPAQHMDATIRCYLLGECIEKALNIINYES
jgi:hypothetical protein